MSHCWKILALPVGEGWFSSSDLRARPSHFFLVKKLASNGDFDFCPPEHLFIHCLALTKLLAAGVVVTNCSQACPSRSSISPHWYLYLSPSAPGFPGPWPPGGKYFQGPVHSKRCIPLAIAGKGYSPWLMLDGSWCVPHFSFILWKNNFGACSLGLLTAGSVLFPKKDQQDNISRTWPFLFWLFKPCFPSLRAFAKFSYLHASPSLDYVLGNTQKLPLEAL